MVLVCHVGYGALILDMCDIGCHVTVVLVDLSQMKVVGGPSGAIGWGRWCRVVLARGYNVLTGPGLGGLGTLDGHLDVFSNAPRGRIYVHVPRRAGRGLRYSHKQQGVPMYPRQCLIGVPVRYDGHGGRFYPKTPKVLIKVTRSQK